MQRSATAHSSLWEKTISPPAAPAPPSESHFDVLVIGSGIAGVTTAYLLAREKRRVLVLEAEPYLAAGQTAKTTAHLSSVLDDRFRSLEATRGQEITRLAAASHAAAIDRIEQNVREEGIDCGFERLDGYLLLGPSGQPAELEEEFEAARRAGLEVEFLDRSPFSGWSKGPCLRFPRQGQFHPLRYLNGLIEAFRRLGGEIVTGARVKEIEGGTETRASTEDGRTFTAGAVVVATNTPFIDRFAIHTKQAPYLTYALAAVVPPEAVPRGLYWDTEDPYHYVRLAREGTLTHLIVGGEDHKTGQASDQEDRFRRLEAWARKVFPELGPIAARWSGQVMETIDGLGFIGPNPNDEPNIFIATGDSGMGLTHGTIAGLLLTDLIQGRSNPWAKAYDPARKPVWSAWDYLKENLNVAAQYAQWFTAGDVKRLETIPKNDGAVIRSGLSKLAAYRDESGKLHLMSAVCPHLSCVVQWNSAEKTWDCPCHGSRFDCTGRVIQGPAVSDLEPASEPAKAKAGAGSA
jgi:glycine/D-amino acid oxidase-like deaminating enzyme/nitrite reductase/ring-hydroxylating ferredoxin subunit